MTKKVSSPDPRQVVSIWPTALAAGLLTTAMLAAGFLAPTEATMGHAQRILYLHVPVAWASLLCMVIMAGTGLLYLLRRNLAWDHWSRASSELGWLVCSLTLLSGSLWARAAWGTWWTWEPRLTTAFILWAIYSGYLIVRSSLDDRHHAARLGAVLAIIGAADLPMVVMATRWFRGIHPASPEMNPTMRILLLANVAVFSALIVWLLVQRRAQLRMEMQLTSRDSR